MTAGPSRDSGPAMARREQGRYFTFFSQSSSYSCRLRTCRPPQRNHFLENLEACHAAKRMRPQQKQ